VRASTCRVDKDDTCLADDVQNEILNRLAKIAQLKVACRTSGVTLAECRTVRPAQAGCFSFGVIQLFAASSRQEFCMRYEAAREQTARWAKRTVRQLSHVRKLPLAGLSRPSVDKQPAVWVAARVRPFRSPKRSPHRGRRGLHNFDVY
ncbi:MAG TPA: hypothetical protein VE242_04795, partial [Chthoniobacterales bacterium]|nr:hypothetical protein [Chthoniobacterales bacterium]